MATQQDLVAAVAALTDAVAALAPAVDALKAAAVDPAVLQSVVDQVNAATAAVNAAVK